MDFWFTNDPTAMVWIYKYNWEIILDEQLHETWLTNSDIDRQIRNKWIDIENDETYWDSAEPKSIEELSRMWWNIKWAVKWKDSVKFGIDVLKQYTIKVTATSTNLIKEKKKYKWAVDKNWKATNIPIDKFNHLMDATRYWWVPKLQKWEQEPWLHILW